MDRPRGYTTPCYHLIQVLHLGHMTLEPAPRTDKDQRMQLGKKKDLLYICTKQHSPVESLIFIHHFMNFDWKTEKLHFKFLFFFIFSANNLSISLSSFSTVNLSHYFRKANCVTVQPAINPIKTNLQTHYKLSVWTERLSLNRSYHYKSMWPESHLSSHPCPQIQRSILLFKFH